jgi:hypothetical protein
LEHQAPKRRFAPSAGTPRLAGFRVCWLDAANRQDLDRLLELSDPNIEIVGPRGSGHGHQLLRDWLARAGLTLETRQAFVRGSVVALAQHGVWRSSETGAVTGESEVASHFRVRGRRVVQFARYDNLDAALAAAGLSEQDSLQEHAP